MTPGWAVHSNGPGESTRLVDQAAPERTCTVHNGSGATPRRLDSAGPHCDRGRSGALRARLQNRLRRAPLMCVGDKAPTGHSEYGHD